MQEYRTIVGLVRFSIIRSINKAQYLLVQMICINAVQQPVDDPSLAEERLSQLETSETTWLDETEFSVEGLLDEVVDDVV